MRPVPHPLVHLLSPHHPPFAIDFRFPLDLNSRKPLFLNLNWHPTSQDLNEHASFPSLYHIRLFHPRLPWFIDLASQLPLTVQDIITGVWNYLQQPIHATDFYNLEMSSRTFSSQTGQQMVAQAFHARCQAIASYLGDSTGQCRAYHTSQGVKRVDYLGMDKNWTWIGVVPMGDVWEIKTGMTPN
ncbi:hypothetical protein GG344DRAFT_50909 [Lentinula edodes]|nr:hypothetical protein GG344DRAFT_50909 [Lentinula edodes]